MDPLSLVAGSDGATTSDWESAAAAVLRKSGRLHDDDAPNKVWDALTRTTVGGIEITPLGTADTVQGLPETGAPGAAPFTRGRTTMRTFEGEQAWDIRAQFIEPDAQTLNQCAINDLENGVNSLWIQTGTAGVPAHDLSDALAGVLLSVAPVILDDLSDQVSSAKAFVQLTNGKELAEGTNLGGDPIGLLTRGRSAQINDVVTIAKLAQDAGCLGVVVDATAVHDQGASDAQELGYSMAVGAAYLRALTDAGMSVDDAATLIEFRYAATAEQFVTIAKLRAARQLWNRVLEICGVDAARRGQRQHAVTSRPMMSKYDPYVNMLRTCVAAFAAGVGGADAVTVLPFDARIGLPDDFSRRIARNTNSLLISEAHVSKVADPAGGSYVVEKLTADIAAAGWQEFGGVEESGGIVQTINDGTLSAKIGTVAAERDSLVARRKRPMTGLTEFPNLSEEPLERRDYPEDSLEIRSYGWQFEQLRNDPPSGKAFLATMGPIAAHTARATFASNLLATGGIGSINPGSADNVQAVLAHYREAGTPNVVCLCGSDAQYSEWGADLVTALRDAGASWIVLAGKPINGINVDDTCALGVNALDFVTRTRDKL